MAHLRSVSLNSGVFEHLRKSDTYAGQSVAAAKETQRINTTC